MRIKEYDRVIPQLKHLVSQIKLKLESCAGIMIEIATKVALRMGFEKRSERWRDPIKEMPEVVNQRQKHLLIGYHLGRGRGFEKGGGVWRFFGKK